MNKIFKGTLQTYSAAYVPLPTGDYLRPLSAGGGNRSRRGKLRHKRPKPQGSSDSYASPPGPPRRVPNSSWPSSESSQPHMGAPFIQASQTPFFPMMATQPVPEQPPRPQQQPGATTVVLQPPDQTQFSYNFNIMQSAQSLPGMQLLQMDPFQNLQPMQNFHNLQPIAPAQSVNPYVAPVMAVILPNYTTFTPGYPSIYPPSVPSILPQVPITTTGFAPGSAPFPHPQFQAQPVPDTQSPLGPLLCSHRASSSVGEEEEEAGPRALFSSSRSSSPLQLNLLQEELPKPNEGQSSTGHNHSESLHEQHANQVNLLFLSTFTFKMPKLLLSNNVLLQVLNNSYLSLSSCIIIHIQYLLIYSTYCSSPFVSKYRYLV